MTKEANIILLDATAIIGAHRYRIWGTIRNHFQLETVEKCLEECATGCRDRHDYVVIEAEKIRKEMIVHQVDNKAIVEAGLRSPGYQALHPGEKHLLAHALTRSDVWLLTSQDIGCIRVAYDFEIIDDIISLEEISRQAGSSISIAEPYTGKWLRKIKTQILLGVL